MGAAIPQPQPRDLNSGDRIRIRPGGRPLLPELVGQVGTIAESSGCRKAAALYALLTTRIVCVKSKRILPTLSGLVWIHDV